MDNVAAQVGEMAGGQDCPGAEMILCPIGHANLNLYWPNIVFKRF